MASIKIHTFRNKSYSLIPFLFHRQLVQITSFDKNKTRVYIVSEIMVKVCLAYIVKLLERGLTN